jgi:hypothetical protein
VCLCFSIYSHRAPKRFSLSSSALSFNCLYVASRRRGRIHSGNGQHFLDKSSDAASKPESWGMSFCFSRPLVHHTDNTHSEPRGFSNLLNPSRPSGDVQKHYVHGRPVSVYEENGRLYHAWKRGTYPYPMDEVRRIGSRAARP